MGRTTPWVEGIQGDFNLDARQEVQLANDKLLALIAPSRGGQVYELDVRTIRAALPPLKVFKRPSRGST